jgi:hypothetical protein
LGFEEVGIHIEDGRSVSSKVPIARKKHGIEISRCLDCSCSSCQNYILFLPFGSFFGDVVAFIPTNGRGGEKI